MHELFSISSSFFIEMFLSIKVEFKTNYLYICTDNQHFIQ